MAKPNPAFTESAPEEAESGAVFCSFHVTVVSFDYAAADSLSQAVSDSVRRYGGVPFQIDDIQVVLEEDNGQSEFHMEDPTDVPSLEWTGSATVIVSAADDLSTEEVRDEVYRSILNAEDFRDDSGQFRWMSLSPEGT